MEMETIVAESGIQRSLQSKVSPATKYLIIRGGLFSVYRERTAIHEGPFTVTNILKKIISVTDGTKVKPFNISSMLPISPKTNDAELKYEMETTQAYVSV